MGHYGRISMPHVTLPNDQVATLYGRDEITQRVARQIDRAYLNAAASAALIVEYGYLDDDPTTWGKAIARLTDEERDSLDDYQAVLVAGLVRSWSLSDSLPTVESALDLPRGTFEILAAKCASIYNDVPEFGPDGAVDPKADTAV